MSGNLRKESAIMNAFRHTNTHTHIHTHLTETPNTKWVEVCSSKCANIQEKGTV